MVPYLILDDEPADQRCDDGDDVGDEVGDAHQRRAEVRSQVYVNQLENKWVDLY